VNTTSLGVGLTADAATSGVGAVSGGAVSTVVVGESSGTDHQALVAGATDDSRRAAKSATTPSPCDLGALTGIRPSFICGSTVVHVRESPAP